MLEEQREEEKDREEAGTWSAGAVRVPRPQKEEAEEETAAEGGALLDSGQTEGAESDGSRNVASEWTARRWAAGETETVQAGLRTTEQEAGASYGRAVGAELSLAGITPAGSGAVWLDRAVRISLEGLPRTEQEAKVVTLEPGTVDQSGRGLELRRLDRLVRRDARRFDGGFQLL